jgi:hypothetical protein
MRKIPLVAASVCAVMFGLTVYAADQTKPAPKKTTSKKRAAAKTPNGTAQAKTAQKQHRATAKQLQAKPKGKATARKGKKPAKRTATTWRNRQLTPTPDRYKEIQTALAAKGYLSSDAAAGEWNQTSVDALKKFQADQNIEASGKLNSLSLIALGLGPKHDQRASASVPVAQSLN